MVIVDDGSTDGTKKVIENVANNLGVPFHQEIGFDFASEIGGNDDGDSLIIKVVSLPRNVGKGKAVGNGVARTNPSCDCVLVADADGSANISCLDDMIRVMDSSAARGEASPHPMIVVGKRRQEPTSYYSDIKRAILRWGFQTCVRVICFPVLDSNIEDTQCGFKLYRPRSAAISLYDQLHLDRWSHDVELLYLASKRGMSTKQIEVRWKDVPGSKLVDTSSGLNIVLVSTHMLLEVLYMRAMYAFGFWDDDFRLNSS